MNILLITGGIWSSTEYNQLKMEIEFLIAVDGALEEMLACGIIPDLAIGDFDTASEQVVQSAFSLGIEIIRLPRDKNMTDTHAALQYALQYNPTQITILGALGGPRYDHMYANISLLEWLDGHGVPGVIITEHNRLQLLRGSTRKTFLRGNYKYLSIIPLSERVVGLSLIGFRYPLTNGILKRGETKGVSNEWLNTNSQIDVAQVGEVSLDRGKCLIFESSD